MADQPEPIVSADDLPLTFQVKYLGSQPAKGLWGIKHTRRPVDALVAAAKALGHGQILPLVHVEVSTDGLRMAHCMGKKEQEFHRVDTISYGVQDLVYTRVFSMIVVKDDDPKKGVPFDCYAFVCESRNQARQLTYALAAAFQEYGKKVKEETKDKPHLAAKKFAIDLRTPEEQGEPSDEETDA